MRRIINSTYMSIDGVVQNPQNWTFDYRDEAATAFAHDQLFHCDALIMGRRTYESFISYWPTATDADGSAERMNSMPKYVVSDSLSDPTWNNTTVVGRAEFPALGRELKDKPGQDIVQYGYGPVTAVLLREGLLDELRIWLHPITVGGQARDALLAEVSSDARFRLADHRAFDSGMVILSYQPQPTA
ncbi:dihydrofolate reductase family protein [Actinoplanes sp. NPDC051411]|uniref:dihydrofolate reductase family protein n=1 Tax=Actinoplanes sp. NPDC051411 TaxID=3155522 RepID=UPI0034363250